MWRFPSSPAEELFSFVQASVVFWPPTLAGWFVFSALQTHIGMLYLQVPCPLGTVSTAPTSCIRVLHTVCRLDVQTTDQSVSSYCSSIWSICSEQQSTGAWLQKSNYITLILFVFIALNDRWQRAETGCYPPVVAGGAAAQKRLQYRDWLSLLKTSSEPESAWMTVHLQIPLDQQILEHPHINSLVGWCRRRKGEKKLSKKKKSLGEKKVHQKKTKKNKTLLTLNFLVDTKMWMQTGWRILDDLQTV